MEKITITARTAAEFIKAAIDEAVTALSLLIEVTEGGEDNEGGIASKNACEGQSFSGKGTCNL